jgi:hypothetical protein
MAGRGLQECPGILVSALCLKFVGIAIMAFYFAALICATYVGKVQPNPARTGALPKSGDIGLCYGAAGNA